MKKTKQFLGYTLVMFMIVLGCSKDDNTIAQVDPVQKEDPKQPEEPIDPVTGISNPVEVDVQVLLQEGSDLDLTTTKLVSFGESFDVQSNGSTKALLYSEENSFVFLEDAEEKILLMAFFSDAKKEISIASTAEVSLYYSLGAIFQFDGIKEKFLEEFNTIPELDSFYTTLADLFIANPNFLETEAYQNALKDKTTVLLGSKEVIEVTDKVLVSETYSKSGVSIEEKGTSSIGFRNEYRRRTHAFIYKVASKKEGEQEFTPIDGKTDIAANNVLCDKEGKIETPNSFTSVLGTPVDYAQGKAQEYFIKDSEPVLLNIENDESAAKYVVRVIGPSCWEFDKSTMTDKEYEKYEDLNLEFFLYDIALPALSSGMGFSEFDIAKLDKDKLNVWKDIVNSFMSTSIPSVKEALSNREYGKATKDFLQAFTLSNTANVLDLVYEATFELLKSKEPLATKFSALDKAAKPLAIAEAILLANDVILRMKGSRIFSNALEEWEVIATTSNVTLSPQVSSVLIGGNAAILEVQIENNDLQPGQEFEYIWSTTAKYGKIKADDIICCEGTEQISKLSSAYYNPAADYAFLPDDAVDIVYAEVYLKAGGERIFVGKDSAIVKVNSVKWKIVPNGITIKGNTILPLKVVDFEGNSPSPEYKVVWNTSRRHGSLEGLAGIWDQINNNTVNYECTDTETTNGVETFTAKVVKLFKDGREFTLGEAEATILINNDPKKLITTIDSEYFEINHGPEGDGERIQHFNTFKVFPIEDAVSYKLEVLDYVYKGVSQSSQITSFSWGANDDTYLRTIDNETFYWPLYGFQNSINTTSPAYGPGKAVIEGIKGTAILTITIE